MIFEASIAALLFALLSAGKTKKKKTSDTPTTPPRGQPKPDPKPQQPDKPGPKIPVPTPDKPGPDKPKPTPDGPKPADPKRYQPRPGDRIWGDPVGEYSMVGKFSDGNYILMSKDCAWVVEGPKFRNESTAVEAATLAAALALPHGNGPGHGRNSVWGFIDWLESQGTNSSDSAWEVATAVSPMCTSVGAEFWEQPMFDWHGDLSANIDAWRQGIEFDPTPENA